ncbi:MAG: ATP-binding protein [Chloroflexota bacterium]
MVQEPQESADKKIETFDDLKALIRSPIILNIEKARIGMSNSLQKVTSRDNKTSTDFLEIGQWLNVIKHPSVIAIIGSRGSGKSALGYKLLEYLRWTAKAYVVGIPEKSRKLLPDGIGSVPLLEDVPPDSVALVDEAYMMLHSRSSASQFAREISKLINLSRQRGLTLIFVTQEARQLDKNVASSANLIIIKNPGILQLEFERPQFRKILAEAQKMFATIDKDKTKWAYVYAPESNFTGMMPNSLPSFWTPGLSKAYADAHLISEVKQPKKMTKEEKIKMAKELHVQRFTLGEIHVILGVSKSTVKNYVDDYPYRKNKKWKF